MSEPVHWGDRWWPSLRDALDGPQPIKWWLAGSYDCARQWRRRRKLKTGTRPTNSEVLEYLFNKHNPGPVGGIPDLTWYLNEDDQPDYYKYTPNHPNNSTMLASYDISQTALKRRRKDGWTAALIILIPDQGSIAGDRKALAEYAQSLLNKLHPRFGTHPLTLD